MTTREREIRKLVAMGKSNKEIADLLCISGRTVVCHRDDKATNPRLWPQISTTIITKKKSNAGTAQTDTLSTLISELLVSCSFFGDFDLIVRE
ncbi:MAG: helix-turn-helix domain-containing protein [bacterium]